VSQPLCPHYKPRSQTLAVCLESVEIVFATLHLITPRDLMLDRFPLNNEKCNFDDSICSFHFHKGLLPKLPFRVSDVQNKKREKKENKKMYLVL
jgi:hypothetical protein